MLLNIKIGDAPPAPANTVAPVISGSPREGETLTGTLGTWTNATTLTGQWHVNGVAQPGETNLTYTLPALVEDDEITFVVTADSSVTATSNILNFIPPFNLVTEQEDLLLAATSSGTLFNRGSEPVTLERVGGVLFDSDETEYPDGSLYFDGVDDYLLSEDSPVFDVGLTFTIDIDFKSDENFGASRRWIAGQGGPNGNFGWSLWYNNTSSGIRFTSWGSATGNDANDMDTGVIPVQGGRYIVRIDCDGTTMRVYVNGTMEASVAAPAAVANAATTFTVGQRGTNYNSDWFNGWIGGFRIIKGTALTADDAGYDTNDGSTPTLAQGSATFRPNGAWTWFNHARGFNVNGADVIGAVDKDGYVEVHDIDNGTTHRLRSSPLADDDHVNPAILHLDNGTIMAFAPSRNGPDHYQYVSTNPNDASSFGAEQSNDGDFGRSTYGYAQAHQLEGEANDPIYIFYRADNGGRQMHYSVSDSTSSWDTWTAGVVMFQNNGDTTTWPPYFISKKRSATRIDFCLNDGHPSGTATNSVYHCYLEGGTFYETDGTPLTLPILPNTDLSKVYDGTSVRSWVWDITWDSSGNPAILYARFPSGITGHIISRAIYDGTSWTNEDIVTAGDGLYAGEPYYSGGCCFAPNDPDTAFIAVEDGNNVYQIRRFERNSAGNWASEARTDEAQDAIRPFFPVGSDNVFYMTGRYDAFTDFNTTIKRFDGTQPTSIPSPTPSALLAGIEAHNPVSNIRNDLSLQKLDESFVEYAITSALDANGINLVRWWEGTDRTNPTQQAPGFGLGTLAKLYDAEDIPPLGATGTTGISASTPNDTQDFSAAVSTGTWTPTTSGGVSGFLSEDASATLTYTLSVPANGRITIEGPTVFSQGAQAKVVVRQGGAEIAPANYATWLVGGDRIVDMRNPGSALGVYTVAKDLAAGTYTVEISFPGAVNPDTKRLFAKQARAWPEIPHDATGVHGTATANSDSGELSDRTFEPGTVLVYEMANSTRLAWKYWRTAAAGIVNFSAFESDGTPVALDTTSVDMAGANALSEITVIDDLTPATYYLHVELQNTDINFPRLYSHGAVAYNEEASGAADAPIDILDMPLRPEGGLDVGTHVIAGPPALDVAMHVKRPADATYEWVGSVHGFESDESGNQSNVTNTELTVTVDGQAVDYDFLAGFDFSRGTSEIVFVFKTFFLVPADNSQEWALVTRTVRYLPGGIVRHRLQREHLLDMQVDLDFSLNMLQVPNPNTGTNYADSIGGGFTSLTMEDSGTIAIGEYNGAGADTTTYTDLNREAQFSNGTWTFTTSLDNPNYVREQYEEIPGAVLGSRVLNYSTGFVKFYSEASGGFIIPAGTTFDIERTFRISPVAPT